ncbi:hypothetical protein MTX78_20835 [Hymenobacter tibetensis]|uniref:Uncharacterized protein n=1 Tax=Hymenobacter tibetensis TaxID=497967 RepID=A0ABY4CWW1_9BACT|nr:hypothetical protein [Hymenobacter tibetensis]UOG74551.1 hypothetical protein MTX78_20835 [Hymenobacter tibetensis]
MLLVSSNSYLLLHQHVHVGYHEEVAAEQMGFPLGNRLVGRLGNFQVRDLATRALPPVTMYAQQMVVLVKRFVLKDAAEGLTLGIGS